MIFATRRRSTEKPSFTERALPAPAMIKGDADVRPTPMLCSTAVRWPHTGARR